MTTSTWIQSWWPWWMKFIARFLVASSPHLRRVAPGAKGQPCASYHGLDERLLEEHSVSSLGMLALLSRWASRGRSKKSSASAENASEWARMLQRIVEHLVVPFLGSQLCFYMDSSVICVPALPIFGEHPIACAIRDGNIFLANLGSTALGTNLIKALGSVRLLEIGAQFDFFLKQLLHQCGHALEAPIADRLRPHGENVAGDGLRQAPDPMDLVRKPLPDVLLGATGGGGTYVRNQQSFRLPPTCCHARQSSDYRHCISGWRLSQTLGRQVANAPGAFRLRRGAAEQPTIVHLQCPTPQTWIRSTTIAECVCGVHPSSHRLRFGVVQG